MVAVSFHELLSENPETLEVGDFRTSANSMRIFEGQAPLRKKTGARLGR